MIAQLKVGDKVLLKCTASIQSRISGRENIIEQPTGKIPVFKIIPMEGEDK